MKIICVKLQEQCKAFASILPHPLKKKKGKTKERTQRLLLFEYCNKFKKNKNHFEIFVSVLLHLLINNKLTVKF